MSVLTNLVKTLLASLDIRISRISHIPRGILLEQDLKRLFNKNPPKTIFDVGANIGQTVRQFARHFPDSSIYAFEPVEKTHRLLRANTCTLSHVFCQRLALGEANVDVRMRTSPCSEWSTRVEPENLLPDKNYEKVTMARLDDFCEKHHIKNIDLLKIDCEGFDLQVLLGGASLLSNHQIEAVLCEVTFVRDKSHTEFQTVDNFLFDLGYVFYALYDYSWNDHRYSYANALFVRKDLWS